MLYDVAHDPAETTNLAHEPQHAARLQSMLARLAEIAEQASVEPMQWDAPYQGPGYECATCPKHRHGDGVADPWAPWL